MNHPRPRRFVLPATLVAAAAAAVVLMASRPQDTATAGADNPAIAAAPPALRLALAEVAGDTPLDQQIRTAQDKVREQVDVPRLERLATLFISKARTSGDPGFYTQAEACAEAMPTADGGEFAAALIRGHVRHALHDFAAAERIARDLVAGRGMFLDHGLLGDVLLDLGRLDAARESYQKMLDLKPGLQSYARAAQLRWLVGDIEGCRELLATAASAGSQRDPESRSWVLARRAALELQCNTADTAVAFADEALALTPDYPAALVVRGRAALALGRTAEAVASLTAAAARYPLPEHLWGQAEACRVADRCTDAEAVEAELLRTGQREDPRTLALWLATTRQQPALALRLAEAEYAGRQDAYTLDVLALARLQNGDLPGARAAMQQVLAVGVREARFFLHAALIAEADGDTAAAARHADAARSGAASLWPSERRELNQLSARI